jgi:hypothetical protein
MFFYKTKKRKSFAKECLQDYSNTQLFLRTGRKWFSGAWTASLYDNLQWLSLHGMVVIDPFK